MRHSRFHSRIHFLILGLACLLLLAALLIVKLSDESDPAIPIPNERRITIIDRQGRQQQLPLEQFIIGVVAAEMPASFDEEALKAQAVAARTYILSHCPPYGQPRHDGAIVCCDSAHCQAYSDELQLREQWGENYDKYYAKIAAAVLATQGEILFSQDKIAQTPFCSTCGGRTEDAASCWGSALPYLIAVDCGYCSHSPKFCSYQLYNLDEVAAILSIGSDTLEEMAVISSTPGGRVDTVVAGDNSWSGTELRNLLALNSAAFNWLILGNNIIFTTIGYGHGVGMCQYGADGMAQAGYDYRQILQHYYPGTQIKTEQQDISAE